MDVAALARLGLGELRHEGRDLALAFGDDLEERLEERGLVGRSEAAVHADRGFDHARPGLLVEALDRDVHAFAEVED